MLRTAASSRALRRDQIETRGSPCLLRSFAVIRGSFSPIFAILAMFGFVVSDSLPKLLSPEFGSAGPGGCNTLRQDDLSQRAQ